MLELYNSPFFGIALTVIAFWIGDKIQRKTQRMICNPLMIAMVIIIGVLLIFRIPYEAYSAGGNFINMFLAPATACLGVSIYTKFDILKKNFLPILIGCTAGSLTSMASVYGLCHLFGLSQELTVSLLPKSVTTPIAISISESYGGVIPVTIIAVIFTGILGSILAPYLIKVFHISDPMTAGLSIGACSHAMGTSKAIELGETQGAMSGLAIGICGMITVLFSLLIT